MRTGNAARFLLAATNRDTLKQQEMESRDGTREMVTES